MFTIVLKDRVNEHGALCKTLFFSLIYQNITTLKPTINEEPIRQNNGFMQHAMKTISNLNDTFSDSTNGR